MSEPATVLCDECEKAPATKKLEVHFEARLPDGYKAILGKTYSMCDSCYEQAIDPILHPYRLMQPDGTLFVADET